MSEPMRMAGMRITGLARFPWRYCHARPDRSLGGRTPYVVHTETTTDPSRSELTITESALVQ